MKNGKIIYLVKANNELISQCDCETASIGEPVQMDCPWCGCGWLFICSKCRKPFTFARAEALDITWNQLAHNDLGGKWGRQPTDAEIEEWIDFMKILLKGIRVGKQYVYIDGWVLETDETNLQFEGWYAKHEFANIPQVVALSDKSLIESTIENKNYWEERHIEE